MSNNEQRRHEVAALRFGVDTVRFNFSPDFSAVVFDLMFEGLSVNSPQNDNLSFMGRKVTGFFAQTRSKKILQLQYEGDMVICVEKILDAGIARSLAYTVTFYAAFFYIPSLEGMLESFLRVYGVHAKVSRVDLALDVLASVDDLWKSHRTKAQKKYVIRKAEKIETFYLGPKANNKRHFIRVYDKKLDSQKKGKFHLFASYFLEDMPVSRIEVQINVLSVSHFRIQPTDITESTECSGRMWEVFRDCCMNESGTDFAILPFASVRKKLSSPAQVQEFLDELPYARRMLGYARRLQEHGFDPVEYLRAHLAAEAGELSGDESSDEGEGVS